VVSVDAGTGALTIKGAGTATVTVTAEETDLYCRATKNVTVTVEKAPLKIQAYDKTITAGQSAPVLGKDDYSVTGLVNGDQLVKEPTIAYASTPNTAVPGSVKINVSDAAVAVPGNYDIRYVSGVLVIIAGNTFDDIKPGEYYYDAVIWAVNHNPQITNGMSATKFSPDTTCTRGQVVTFLWRAKGCPEPKISINPFTDVKADAYYYKAVLWAIEEGITNGTSKTTFSPDAPCTRAHVVTFLWRSAGKPAAGTANPFKDVASGQYYTDAVLWAVSKDITNGTSANTFSPDSPCTRGQIVTFLYRAEKQSGK
jgi:S-layer homology domain.